MNDQVAASNVFGSPKNKKAVRREWIEDLVIRKTMELAMDDKVIEAIVSMLMDL